MKSESGRSLIEMLGVLAVGAVMTAAAYGTYNMLRTNQIRNMAVSELEQIARNAKILLEARADYTGVSIDYLIKAGAITSEAAPIGGDDWSIVATQDGKGFSINLTNLTTSECAYFATKKLNWASKISVNKIEDSGSESCLSAPRNLISIIVE
jgi:Tfp pilus assembly protein PilE